MKQVRHLRPSPAMVVACIALTVALGGTSYAAITLPKNSVGAKQLKKNAVTGPKIKANAVTGAKVANDSLTGADVNEASLGVVPSAANATNAANATSATNATNATSAANAGNADTLGGIGPTGFVQPMFAVVESTGTLVRGRSVVSSAKGGVGNYIVRFNRNITTCAFVATLGVTGFGGGSTSGVVDVAGGGGTTDSVFVDTEDPLGTQADRPFYLQVVC